MYLDQFGIAWSPFSVQTSMLRALAPTTPTYVFPAMNTLMYEHPLTAEHLRIVREVIGYNVIGPIGKNLACGDVGECRRTQQRICIYVPPFGGDIGVGAMTEWRDIVNIVVDRFRLQLKS